MLDMAFHLHQSPTPAALSSPLDREALSANAEFGGGQKGDGESKSILDPTV